MLLQKTLFASWKASGLYDGVFASGLDGFITFLAEMALRVKVV
jgi:hypothetical protein